MAKKLFGISSRDRFAPVATRPDQPKTKFYLNFGMITPSEYKACLVGDMEIQQPTKYHPERVILNLNADSRVTPVLTGCTAKLYSGRAIDVSMHYLFGTDLPEK